MPDEDITICLMGDTKYGKTSLIATLCGCVNQKAHGFDTAYAFKAEPEGPSGLTREGFGEGTYNHIQESFFEGGEATAVERTDTYRFRFGMDRITALGAELPRSVKASIVDTGGAVWMSGVRDFRAQDSKTWENFVEYRDRVLPQAKALVLVIPLFNYWDMPKEETWRARMNALLTSVATDYPGIGRIAVVMTHYERLFIDYGAYAAEIAMSPETARLVLRDATAQMRRRGLAEPLFNGTLGSRRILFMPASAHGFVRGNGCPNLDPVSNSLLHRSVVNDTPRGRRDIWRPFCTADPFLFAAFGEQSGLMFGLDELASDEPPVRETSHHHAVPAHDPEGPVVAPVEKSPGTFSRFFGRSK